MAVCEKCALEEGEWINAADVTRMAKELDTAMSGTGTAEHPALCDVVADVKKRFKDYTAIAASHRKLMRAIKMVLSEKALITTARLEELLAEAEELIKKEE